MTPSRETRDQVGLSPTRLQNAAGPRMEPPVSPPSAKVQRPAATAAAGPLDDAPGLRSRFHGLRATPYGGSRVGPAWNSWVLSVPRKMAPAASQARDHGGVAVGHEVGEDARAAGDPDARDQHLVLDREGDPVERRARLARAQLLGRSLGVA